MGRLVFGLALLAVAFFLRLGAATVRGDSTAGRPISGTLRLLSYVALVIGVLTVLGSTTVVINAGEVGVRHEERHAGVSNYSFYQLIRLNFDLITGFSLAPLQYFTMFAGLCAAGSFVMVMVLAYGRLFLHENDDTHGVFTLFGILFFLLSVAMIGIGLIGEYVGRTYNVVRARQRYHVKEMLETKG